MDTSKAAAYLGRKGGAAGSKESKRRGDSAHYSALRAKRATIYGFRNVAFHSGPAAEGYAVWYPTGAARDEALSALRSEAVARGLSRSAAQAGIYAVTMSQRHLTDEQREELSTIGYVRTA